MDQVTKAIVAGLARHVVTALGAYGVAISDDTITQVLSGIVALGMAVWSARQKKATVAP